MCSLRANKPTQLLNFSEVFFNKEIKEPNKRKDFLIWEKVKNYMPFPPKDIKYINFTQKWHLKIIKS